MYLDPTKPYGLIRSLNPNNKGHFVQDGLIFDISKKCISDAEDIAKVAATINAVPVPPSVKTEADIKLLAKAKKMVAEAEAEVDETKLTVLKIENTQTKSKHTKAVNALKKARKNLEQLQG